MNKFVKRFFQKNCVFRKVDTFLGKNHGKMLLSRSVPDGCASFFMVSAGGLMAFFYCAGVGILLAGGGREMVITKGGDALAEINEKSTRKRTGNNGNGFKKGQSGNPGGRPKLTEEEKDVLEQIKTLAPSAVSVLESMISDDGIAPAYRIKAAEIVLDRVVCKAEAMMRMQIDKESEIVVNLVGVEDLSE
jgi:hypothetical protein